MCQKFGISWQAILQEDLRFAKQELEEIIQGCKDQKATANRKLKQPLRLFGKRYVQSKITQIAECEENIKLSIKNISDAIKCIQL